MAYLCIFAAIVVSGVVNFIATNDTGYISRVGLVLVSLVGLALSRKLNNDRYGEIALAIAYIIWPVFDCAEIFKRRYDNTTMDFGGFEHHEYTQFWVEKFSFFLLMQVALPTLMVTLKARSSTYFGVMLLHLPYG